MARLLIALGAVMKNLLIGALIAIGTSAAAHAADMPTKAPITPPPVIQGWTYSLTPYFWATSLNGSTTVKGRTTDVDAGFFDILDHTQFPKGLFQLAALGEARYGRFGLLADVLYMKADLGAGVTRSRGTDAINGAVGVSAGLDTKMVIAEVAAAYEIARWSGLTSPGSSTALDLYAGGRAWWQRGEVQITASGTLNVFDLTFSRVGVLSAEKSVSWVDPLVGARLRHQLPPGISSSAATSADSAPAASFHGRCLLPSTTRYAGREPSPGAPCSATRRCQSTTRKAAGLPFTSST
jgi:hypothetical protein